MEPYYLGAYWGPRGESADECAERLSLLLASLGNVDPRLTSWFKTGGSRKAALKRQVDPSIQALRELLLAGRPRRDDEIRSVMSDLGFRVGLWNGQEVEVGLSVRCGSPAAIAGMTSNTLTMQFPPAEGEAATLYRREVALAVVRAVVAAFEPAWCTWTSDVLRSVQCAQPNEIVIGWATYIANPKGVRTDRLPAGTTAESLGAGLLLQAEGDADSASEGTVLALREALGRALRPGNGA